MNHLERFVERLNAHVFLREFAFSRLQFSPEPGRQLEFADHVILLKDIRILFQLKQREGASDSPQRLESWFRKKVVRDATKQIRDTLRFLTDCDNITVRNTRGHLVNVASRTVTKNFAIVVYDPGDGVTGHIRFAPFHRSRTAGFIHLFDAESYLNIWQMLRTPAEIVEYLIFREAVLSLHDSPGEVPLFGQFLEGKLDAKPDIGFASAVARLARDDEEFDVSVITRDFLERIESVEPSGSLAEYYRVLAEIAQLNRSELRDLKLRFRLCLNAAKQADHELPYRIASVRTGCGFLLIPCVGALVPHRVNGLKNLSIAAKHEQKLERLVGVAISWEAPYFDFAWIVLDYPWAEDPELDRRLVENYPFRSLRGVSSPRYRFRDR